MSDSKPTLVHLNNSQSQRILWLLEELSVPYNLVLQQRSAQHRAPSDMTRYHPMGKAPTLIVSSSDGSGTKTIIESSAIASYLITTYDHEGKFAYRSTNKPDADDDKEATAYNIRDIQLTSFANSTLGVINGLYLFLDILVSSSPWPIRSLFALVARKARQVFLQPEYTKCLDYLETELLTASHSADGPQQQQHRDWFTGGEGSNPGRADFMLSWPFDTMVQRRWVNLDEKAEGGGGGGGDGLRWKGLKAWYERYQARAAWKSALEKGNGYDLRQLGA